VLTEQGVCSMLTHETAPLRRDASDIPVADVARQARRVAECYCGLYAKCPTFRMMSPDEREICTRDKRMDAQRMWKNGMDW
ncbi:MAG: hypothetical protein ACHQQ3_12300, partial [Gemmatimonadales bacterium]